MKLYYLNGDKAGSSVELTPAGVGIGRETDNTIQLLVGGVSRYHAQISYSEGQWLLRDLGSTNGTTLNNVPVTAPVALRNHDRFIIGDQHFRVDADQTIRHPGDPQPETPQADAPAAAPQPAAAPKNENVAPVFVFRPPPVPPPAPEPVTVAVPPPPAPQPAAAPVIDPAPAIHPTPNAAPAPEATILSGDIFGNDKKTDAGPAISSGDIFGGGTASDDHAGHKKNTLRGNLIFALALILILAIGALLIHKVMNKGNSESNASAAAGKEKKNMDNPFFFFYERQRVDEKKDPESGKTVKNVIYTQVRGEFMTETAKSGKTVRYFVLTVFHDNLLEGGKGGMKMRAQFGREGEIPEEAVAKLLKGVKKSDFMLIEQKIYPFVAGNANFSRMSIGYEDQLNDVVFFDDDGDRNSFYSNAKGEIELFLENACLLYGLELSAAEVVEEGEKAFAEAVKMDEQYTQNGDPSALQPAINAYQRADNFLDRFEQRSEKCQTVKENLSRLRKEKLGKGKEGRSKVDAEQSRGNYAQAVELCKHYMKYFHPESKEYNEFREQKIQLEEAIRKRGGKGDK